MAKVNGPLLSFGAAGQVGQAAVFSKWKGRQYVRRYVVPSNPQSADQVETRSTFSWLNRVWKTAPADFVAPWQRYVKGRVMTDRNAWIQQNLSTLRAASDLTGLILSPGAAGGLTVTPTITFGNDQITIAAAAPSPLPSGWTIVEFVGVAIRDQDPQSGALYTIEAGSDATSTYEVVLTGLAAGDWAAGGWFVFQRSAIATDLAYGAAVAEIGTVT